MKTIKKALLACILVVAAVSVNGQFSIFLQDSFQESEPRIDLSELLIRSGETEAHSAFEYLTFTDDNNLSYDAIHMNATGEEAGVCCTYNNGSFIAHNCVDFVFPKTLRRSDGDTLRIEFDAIWDIANDAKGETSKIIAYLMYDYPQDGPGFMVYNDVTQHHYGKPAYQLWILNGSNRAFITYGAGLQSGSGFIALPANDPQFWLPGFTEKRVEEGEIDQQDPYPASAYARLMTGETVSDTQWMHYTWEITKDRLSLFWRPSGEPEENNSLLLFMQTPPDGNLDAINEAHGSFITSPPPFYEYIDEMNAFRMFINKKSWFANLSISKSGTPLGTYAEFQNRPVSQRRPKADAGSYELPVFLYNGVPGETTTVTVSLAKGNAAHINNFNQQDVIFEPDSDDLQTQGLSLTLTDIYMSENDTLLFEISQVTGGNYPTRGPQRFFELIIRPSGATSVAETDASEMKIIPNPATSQIRVTFPGKSDQWNLQVMDITGKIIYENPRYNQSEINVSPWAKGVYFVKMLTKDKVVSRKFIKE